ncbi:MAG: hypothetical protein RIS61_33 [Actinomycetota bacterium]
MSAMLPEQVSSIRSQLLNKSLPINVTTIIESLRDTSPDLSPLDLIENADEILAQTIGFGPVEKFIHQSGVTDILVNRFDDVWIDSELGLQKVKATWSSETELRDFAAKLASLVNRRLDDVNPFLDAKLENGIRFHAIIPPLATHGTALAFRIPSTKKLSLDDLVNLKTIDEPVSQILRRIIHNKISFAISGSTGSGKTTILGALLSEVSENERIVIVEDSAELNVSHPNCVSLQTRGENSEGIGAIELKQLIKQTLRMRPDRIVIGEVRGTEVLDLLIALNTGHEGGCVTVHANSAESVIARIEALGLLAKIPKPAVHALLKQAIKVLIHVARTDKGRKLAEISVIDQDSTGSLQTFKALDLISKQKIEPGWQKLQDLINP